MRRAWRRRSCSRETLWRVLSQSLSGAPSQPRSQVVCSFLGQLASDGPIQRLTYVVAGNTHLAVRADQRWVTIVSSS